MGWTGKGECRVLENTRRIALGNLYDSSDRRGFCAQFERDRNDDSSDRQLRRDMQKRFYSRIIILAAIAAIGVAGFVIAQRTSSQSRKPATGRVSPGTTGTRSSRSRRNSPAQTPIRPADPNRAPQAAIDEALYTNEEFFGTSASVARPFATALGLLETLLTQYPKDAQLRLHAARLAERLGQFDRAAAEMNTYADLKKRSPDSLR